MSNLNRLIASVRARLAPHRKAPMAVQPFPAFRYHPDPRATGAVLPSDLVCAACHQTRGYRVHSYYSIEEYDCICPWCIADGRAARTLGASFVQDHEADLPAKVWDELAHRTPGYESWQGEYWLTHCNDACAFHGDLERDAVTHLPPEVEAQFLADKDWLDWPALQAAYASSDCDAALYKFVCLHCGLWRIGMDRS